MTYRSGKSRTQRKYINIALGAVAFFLFVYFWPHFRAVAYPLAEPLIRGYGGTKDGISLVPSFISTYVSSRASLADRNKELEADSERLENKIAEQEAHIREMMSASSIMDLETVSPVIVMYPIAEDVTKLYSTILLSKGYRDGIEKGSLVYVRGRQPVCEIVEVFDKTSLCELFSKGKRTTEAVSASSSITLSLLGAGGGSFVAEVPNDTPLMVGEDVYLRSDQSYKLGTIIAIKKDDQATGSKVYVRGAYNPVDSSIFYTNIRYAP